MQSLLAADSACEVATGEEVVTGEEVADGSTEGFLDTFVVGDDVTSDEFIGLGLDITARAVKLSVDSIANAVVGKYPKKTAIKVVGSKICAVLTLIRAKKKIISEMPSTQPIWGRALKTEMTETQNAMTVTYKNLIWRFSIR